MSWPHPALGALLALSVALAGCERNPRPRADEPPALLAQVEPRGRRPRRKIELPPPAPPAPRPAGEPQRPEDFDKIAQTLRDGKTFDKPGAPPVQRLDEARFRIGQVIVDRRLRRVELSAKVSITTGILEFYLVPDGGRDYESVLLSTAKPSHIHLGLVLIGLKPAQYRIGANGRQEELRAPAPVKISLHWKDPKSGQERHAPASAWLQDRKTQRAPDAMAWGFLGSDFSQGGYLADATMVISALIPDGSAVIGLQSHHGNPYQGTNLGFEVNQAAIPPASTPVRVIIEPAQVE